MCFQRLNFQILFGLKHLTLLLMLSICLHFDSDVPNRVWFDKDVSYDHLKVFGCKACVHVLKDERSKLDVKIKQCIFIGYGQDEFGYRFYDLIDKKLIRSCDIVFFEDQTIEDIDKTEKLDSHTDERYLLLIQFLLLIHLLHMREPKVMTNIMMRV